MGNTGFTQFWKWMVPLVLWTLSCQRPTLPYLAATEPSPPLPKREFRGAWVASVVNIDWPSRPGLSTYKQKSELLTILDAAQKRNLNAVLLQVRPACDALYPSKLEPWSEYLSGQMGQPPNPLWDPLAYAVEQAHARGLELHAWINPFRARHTKRLSGTSPNHISQTHPWLVLSYAGYQWLDPSQPQAVSHVFNVIRDITLRYDIDGIHLDDYFYPYPTKDSAGNLMEFPDHASWRAYQETGGNLSRAEWRRQNINQFVRQLYQTVKQLKPWVKVGISPFGIWRPGYPESIRGLDAYNDLYADSRLWWREGWLDYLSPQLYWSIDSSGQSFTKLLQWWSQENTKRRHLWPGIATHKGAKEWSIQEIYKQIQSIDQLQQPRLQSSGHLHWSMKSLLNNAGGLTDYLYNSHYHQPALIPPSPWLNNTLPAPPQATLTSQARTKTIQLTWNPGDNQPIHLWVLQTLTWSNHWEIQTLPIQTRQYTWTLSTDTLPPTAIALSAMDRFGNLSRPFIFRQRTSP